jgi:hypothetical protein
VTHLTMGGGTTCFIWRQEREHYSVSDTKLGYGWILMSIIPIGRLLLGGNNARTPLLARRSIRHLLLARLRQEANPKSLVYREKKSQGKLLVLELLLKLHCVRRICRDAFCYRPFCLCIKCESFDIWL